jgi:hypothetical protein
MPAAAQNVFRGPAVACALTKLTQLGSRTACLVAPFNIPVTLRPAPARYAADGSIGFASAYFFTNASISLRVSSVGFLCTPNGSA